MLWPVFFISLLLVVLQAAISAKENASLSPAQRKNIKYTLLIITLHMIQPVARLYGRFKHGLTPWRKRGAALHSGFLFVFNKPIFSYWSEKWKSAEEWLFAIEQNLITERSRVKRGGDFDNWDIQVRSGLFAFGRGLLSIEEHGGGKQYLRFKCKTHYAFSGYLLAGSLFLIAVISALAGEYVVSLIMWTMFSFVTYQYIMESAGCLNNLYLAFHHLSKNVQQENAKDPQFIPLAKRNSHFERIRKIRANVSTASIGELVTSEATN